MMSRVVSLIFLCSLLSSGWAEEVREISFRTEDGYQIYGTLHTPTVAPDRKVPGVVLLPNVGHEQQVFGNYAYPGLAVSLAERGVVALRIDWRGIGKSIGELGYRSFTSEQRDKIPLDVKGAINFLVGQSGVDAQRIGIVGDSQAANWGVLGAIGDPRVRVVAMLSGRLEPRAKEYLAKNPQISLLCLSSSNDAVGFPDMSEACTASKNPENKVIVQDNMGAGTTMFTIYRGKFPDAQPLDLVVADWIAEQLKGLGELREASFQSTDGFKIYGDLRIPDHANERNKVPGIVMLHSGVSDRYIYYKLEEWVSKQGIAVFNIDWRGRGKSREQGNYFDMPPELTARTYQDAQGAINFLVSQKGVDADRIAVLGGVLGARAVGMAAMGDPRVKAIVMVSGYGDDKFTSYVAENPRLAIFSVAGTGDVGPATNAVKVHRVTKNPHSQLTILDTGQRSGQIFWDEPQLEQRIAQWLKEAL